MNAHSPQRLPSVSGGDALLAPVVQGVIHEPALSLMGWEWHLYNCMEATLLKSVRDAHCWGAGVGEDTKAVPG